MHQTSQPAARGTEVNTDLLVVPAVRSTVEDNSEVLGKYAAVSYAQRVVGRRETGTFNPLDAELINGMNPDHFLMCYRNLCMAHLAREGKADLLSMATLTDTASVKRLKPQVPVPDEGPAKEK